MIRNYFHLQTWISNWANPYKRYQFQRNIHAMRLGLAVVCASLLGYIFRLSHSEWIPITVFVILGTIPYQGSISEKALERILGTIIGMAIGLALLGINEYFLHHNIVFFLIIAILSAICGFYSLSKHGYAAMLAGLTICMMLGHAGDNWIHEGLLRAANVIIGAIIALNISRLIPIKATMVWRFATSDNFAACAKQFSAVTEHKIMHHEQWQALILEQRTINARLVKARSMMTATALESGMDSETLETMQQIHRSIISNIHLMLVNVMRLPKPHLSHEEQQLLAQHFFSIQHDLRLTSLLLRGEWRQTIHINLANDVAIRQLAAKLPFDTQGFVWTSLNIQRELAYFVDLLQDNREKWLTPNECKRLKKYSRKSL
ncbi:FUSC family protein [Wielerella bovis]|uniref:FUSC family protein n=1 Tax=Wielerella bovis TaxID=2917790 RepID=UPI002019D860|nr:FUSC family protein [Wielerella bovis]ULJ68839.1 FUSC family protein [Wielerella bovis]